MNLPISSDTDLRVTTTKKVRDTRAYHEENVKLHASWVCAERDVDGSGGHRARRRLIDIKNQVIAFNHGLAVSAARPFIGGVNTQHDDDYLQAAFLALWDSFTKWDPVQAPFATYSFHRMRGEVQRAVCRAEFPLLSYGDFTLRGKVRAFELKFLAKHEREPSDEEIAEAFGSQTPAAVETISVVRGSRHVPVSFDHLAATNPKHVEARKFPRADATATFSDYDMGDVTALIEAGDAVAAVELYTIIGRLLHGRTFVEMASESGLGREQLRRVANAVTEKLASAAADPAAYIG